MYTGTEETDEKEIIRNIFNNSWDKVPETALSCNVPLLVWCTQTMNQEYGSHYEPIPCTSVPYWDERCGEIFYKQEEFEPKFDEFISKLDTYKPREYILENLSV